MKQKQIINFFAVVFMTTALMGTDHFTSTTGNAIVQSTSNDVTILADTGGSTGKINIQAGTTTPGTTTPGDIGLSAANNIILKSIMKIVLDAPMVEETSNTHTYTEAKLSSELITELGSSTINGNLVITDDITIDADLTVHGDMFVLGGSFIVNNGIKLQVNGLLLCDGQEVSGKKVSIIGNIYGATTSDPGVETMIIRNYKPTSGATVEISALATIVANNEIVFTDNTSIATGISGVDIFGTVKAYGAIKFLHNSNNNTVYGVYVPGTIESYNGDIIFADNVGGGSGIYTTSTATIIAHRNIEILSNLTTGIGGGGFRCDQSSITAGVDIHFKDNSSISGIGILIENSGTAVTAGRNIYFKGNTGSGANVSVGASTTVTAGNEVIFDEATTLSSTGLVKSGTINGDVVFNGGLTVQATTTFEDNVTVNGFFTMSTASTTLTIGKSLYTLGGSITMDAATVTLTAIDDVIFDGNNVDSTIVTFNPAVINGRDIVVKNFNTSTTSILVNIFSTTTLTAARDIIIKNNTKTNSGNGVRVSSSSAKLSSERNIIIRNNTCTAQPGVLLDFGSIIAKGDVEISHNTGGVFGVYNRFSFTALQGRNIYLTDNYGLNANPGFYLDTDDAPVLDTNGTITNGELWVARNRSVGGNGAYIGPRVIPAHRVHTLGNTATGYNVANSGNFREFHANNFTTALSAARQYNKTDVPLADFPS